MQKRARKASEPDRMDDYTYWLKKQPVRIALGVVVVVVGIYATGKFLRLLGGAVEDAKYFTNALKR